MRQLDRRTFIGCVAGVVASARYAAPKERLPISFSTLGCPAWTWKTVLEQADKLGYAAIELRGIQGEMDLTRRPEFIGSRLAESVAEVDSRGLRISDLGASTRLHEDDPQKRAAQLDEARRFMDLAVRLKSPYVRVFPDKVTPGRSKAETVELIIAGLRTLAEHARGSGITVLLESHGDFTDSPTLLEIMKGAGTKEVALLWDAHHTFVAGGEAPDLTFRRIAPYIRHTHLKDSRAEGTGRRYVLTGSGTVPVRETVQVLVAGGYRGYFGLEWEKVWHPEIEDPEVAFPQYAKVMGEYLMDARR